MPTIYTARRQCESYGHAIGILVLDIDCPYVPGDVGNASTFSYPVLYQAVRGAPSSRCSSNPIPEIWTEIAGIDISESILITKDGCETLANFPRQLFVKE